MRYEGTYIYYIIYLKTIKRIYALRVFRKSIYAIIYNYTYAKCERVIRHYRLFDYTF